MRITPQRPERREVGNADRTASSTSTPVPRPQQPPEARGTAVLEPALASLREMPDVDLDRVAEVKAALARGEVKFDPQRLADLIDRYHGGRG